MRHSRILQMLLDNKQVERRVEIVANGDETTLYLYDAIVNDAIYEEWGYGVAAQTLVPKIRDIKSGTLHLRINSPGGDVFAGQAIAQALRECKARVVVHVDGVAASAASVVAIAGAEIEMAEGAFFMIHESSTMAWGVKGDLRSTADLLEQVDDSIAAQYARRTGQPKADMLALMEAETWMNADTAVEKGFADRVAVGTQADARWNLTALRAARDEPADPLTKSAASAADRAAIDAETLRAAVSAELERRARAQAEAGANTDALLRRLRLAREKT